MKAAILTIGDELTSGYRLDTNSQYISRRLTALPADVVLHISVNDELEAVVGGLTAALGVAEILVITGGIGPTEDDLTRQAIAAHFGLELVENAEALERIQSRFAHRGLGVPASNRVQALVPAGSQVIQNDRGTAAGFYLQAEGNHIFVTPGVPYEMKGMLEGFVLPQLRDSDGVGGCVLRTAVKVYGLPESEINDRIKSMLARGRNPLLGSLPSLGTITIEVVASASTEQEAQRLIDADHAALRSKLGQHIISEDERDLPQVLADLLLDRRLTIAVAEVGTSGLVNARLSEPKGCSRWLRTGTVPEDNAALKGKQLAQTMAAQEATRADIGVGVSELLIAEHSALQAPYAVAHVAVRQGGHGMSRKLRFNGNRLRARAWVADAVLNVVRRWLMQSNDGTEGNLG